MDKKELSLAQRFKVHAAVTSDLTLQLTRDEAMLFARCLQDWETAQKIIEDRKIGIANQRESERRKKAVLTKWEMTAWSIYLGIYVWISLTALFEALF